MEAKIAMLFGKLKNRVLRPQEAIIRTFWGRVDGMAVARGREREGVIRRSRPGPWSLAIKAWQIFGKNLALAI